ncbi:hypothetical protein KY284_001121 [Solanum tuberosum]|nr:hypothetical protein KY284_001121 [Solanum tuberosum]
MIRHGGKMFVQGMMMEINRNLHYLAITRYPWLWNIPDSLPLIVKFFEAYTPLIECKVVKWKLPNEGVYKCISDGASKGNPGPSASAFCIRNDAGEFIFAEAKSLESATSLEVVPVALRSGLEFLYLKQFAACYP